MGFQLPHALGREQILWTDPEPSFGQPGVSNVFSGRCPRVLKSMFKAKTERRDRADARQTRSLQERITGMVDASWSVEQYLLPMGDAGYVDSNDFLVGLLGSVALDGGYPVYTLSNSQTNTSFFMVRGASGAFTQMAVGCWVNTGKFSLKGGDEPKVTFEGGCQNVYTTGRSVLTANVSASDTTFTVSVADSYNYTTVQSNGAASYVAIGTDDNSHHGYRVTAVNHSTGVVTVATAFTGSHVIGDAVVPFVRSPISNGSPIPYTLGSFSIDSVTSAPIVSADIEVSNNFKAFKDQPFNPLVPDGVQGFRSVKGTITIKARSDQIHHLVRYERSPDVTRAVVLVCGSGAGTRATFTMPNIEVEDGEIEVTDSTGEESLVKLPFVALATSAGEDELTLSFV